jgi:8-oxo-dGTP pyrophosphatase MutT (NUDIX family)
VSGGSRTDYYNSLPRKRSAVGVLIFQDDKILVLEPTYKPNWLVPGGVVEASESPFEAAVRECQEEIGHKVNVTKFLCADYKRGNQEIGDAVHFLFLGEISANAEIRIDTKEIKRSVWLSPEEALSKFDVHLATRVRCGLKAISEGRPYYCEDGEVIV